MAEAVSTIAKLPHTEPHLTSREQPQRGSSLTRVTPAFHQSHSPWYQRKYAIPCYRIRALHLDIRRTRCVANGPEGIVLTTEVPVGQSCPTLEPTSTEMRLWSPF